MPFGFLKQIKSDIKNEFNKQIDNITHKKKPTDNNLVENMDESIIINILQLLKGGTNNPDCTQSYATSSSSSLSSTTTPVDGLQQLLQIIQLNGGRFPTTIKNLLPSIMKISEIYGHGIGDCTIRNEINENGELIDEYKKIIIDGRKIYAANNDEINDNINCNKIIKELTQIGKNGESGIGLKQQRGSIELIQDYISIKTKCLENGKLFEDLQFPAINTSVFYSKSNQRDFIWRRPTEIVTSPHFFIEGATRFDVKQGELGDCWLLAAVANLTLNKQTFHQVIPEDNSFINEYCGIFHFRFWQYGKWVDVVIDDRLPTDHYGKLLFMHSEDNNEFWSALLEKAYAKLHGSYEALKGGTTCEALEDFTGGVCEMYEIQNAPKNLFKIMLNAFERSSFMGCSIEPDINIIEAETNEGLIRGHAYSITNVKLVDIATARITGKIPLLRIRNPWGNEIEWKGAWSDGSQEWQFLQMETKEELGLTFDADGEFWMSFKDFTKYFQRLEICNLSADSLDDDDDNDNDSKKKKKWEMNIYEGAWIKGCTAGGCRNHLETFAFNPQYIINLIEPDSDSDDSKCTFIIALMQRNRRAQRKHGIECLTIGFAIYHITQSNLPKPLPISFFKYNTSIARSPTFINLREISCRFKLPPGTYCIVPSTFEPNEEGEFIIRVFSEAPANMKEHDSPVGIGEVDERIKDSISIQDENSKRVAEFFKTVAGIDGEIDWIELKEILDLSMKREFDFDGFSRDVCRSMVAMMDIDHSGRLGINEFIQLWKNIRTWKNVFKLYDNDKSGHLNSFELRGSLTSAGYNLNNKILQVLVLRYGDKEGKIWFDDFIMCTVKLKAMIEIFKERNIDENNKVKFTLEDWIENTLYS